MSCKLHTDSDKTQQSERRLCYLMLECPCSFSWRAASSGWLNRGCYAELPSSLLSFVSTEQLWAAHCIITEHKHFCFYKQLPVNMIHSVSPGWNRDNNTHTDSLRKAGERLNTMLIIVNLNIPTSQGWETVAGYVWINILSEANCEGFTDIFCFIYNSDMIKMEIIFFWRWLQE